MMPENDGRPLSLPAGSPGGLVEGISTDGKIMTGQTLDGPIGDIAPFNRPPMVATRWVDGVPETLGTLGGDESIAFGISGDGNVIVGKAEMLPGKKRQHAFRWTQKDGMTDLGTLGGYASFARGASADGSVVVGASHNTERRMEAFRWTKKDGMAGLGFLSGVIPSGSGMIVSSASGISSDGAVIVGTSDNAAGKREAFRWTRQDGMTGLGFLPGMTESVANAISADGLVVVGTSGDDSGWRAFRWTKETDMQSVEEWLRSAEPSFVPVAGDFLGNATGISANGSVISGLGVSQGALRPWIARVGR